MPEFFTLVYIPDMFPNRIHAFFIKSYKDCLVSGLAANFLIKYGSLLVSGIKKNSLIALTLGVLVFIAFNVHKGSF